MNATDKEVLDYLRWLSDHDRGGVTVTTIARECRKSEGAVRQALKHLINAGLVASRGGVATVAGDAQDSGMTLQGKVSAGPLLSPGDELFESVDLNHCWGAREETYLLEVSGKSMIGAMIDNGDYVVVERRQSAADGDIVVALDDGQATLKYWRTDGRRGWLEAANPDYPPPNAAAPEIIGVVVGVVRRIKRVRSAPPMPTFSLPVLIGLPRLAAH